MRVEKKTLLVWFICSKKSKETTNTKKKITELVSCFSKLKLKIIVNGSVGRRSLNLGRFPIKWWKRHLVTVLIWCDIRDWVTSSREDFIDSSLWPDGVSINDQNSKVKAQLNRYKSDLKQRKWIQRKIRERVQLNFVSQLFNDFTRAKIMKI